MNIKIIGKIGFFFDYHDSKIAIIGKLKGINSNGMYEDEDNNLYLHFTPMGREDMLECIDLDFFSKK